jgi:hypothetical protein
MGKHLSSKASKCIKPNLISDKLAAKMKRHLPQQTSHIIKPNLNDDKSATTNMERQLSSEIDNCNKSDQNGSKSTTAITVKKLEKLKKTKVKKQGPDLRQVSNVDQHSHHQEIDCHRTEASFDSKADSKKQNCDLTTTIQTSKTNDSSKIDSKDLKTRIQTSEINDSTTNSNENSSSGEKICLWMDQKGQVIIKHQFV